MLASTAATPLWGKLGDQYGRKKLFQSAIVIFLIGSALCGMPEHGAADRLPRAAGARRRRAMIGCRWRSSATSSRRANAGATRALFGAVFGVGSVARAAARRVVRRASRGAGSSTSTSPSASSRCSSPRACTSRGAAPSRTCIDYLGTFLVAAVATCLVLVASLGGTTWAWDSPQIIGLGRRRRRAARRCSWPSSGGPPNPSCRSSCSVSAPSRSAPRSASSSASRCSAR